MAKSLSSKSACGVIGLSLCPALLTLCPALLTFSANTTQNECDPVSIDSVDRIVGIRHEKIEGLATSHGLHGIADYVRIKPPVQTVGTNEIRRLVLMADLRPNSHGSCEAGNDITNKPAISCAKSVPGTPLVLIATFEPDNTHDLETETKALVKYVLKEVLNCTPADSAERSLSNDRKIS